MSKVTAFYITMPLTLRHNVGETVVDAINDWARSGEWSLRASDLTRNWIGPKHPQWDAVGGTGNHIDPGEFVRFLRDDIPWNKFYGDCREIQMAVQLLIQDEHDDLPSYVVLYGKPYEHPFWLKEALAGDAE